MPIYEFIERVHVYFTVEAESEEDAWKELDKLNVSYDSVRKSGEVNVIECYINSIEENKNEEK